MPGHAVYIQAVFFAVNPHRPVSDATGHAADAFAAQGRIAEITAEILVTQRHIRQMSVTIGNQNRHDSRADIAKPHFGTCGIARRIEHNGLALRSGAPDLLFDLHPYSPGFRLRKQVVDTTQGLLLPDERGNVVHTGTLAGSDQRQARRVHHLSQRIALLLDPAVHDPLGIFERKIVDAGQHLAQFAQSIAGLSPFQYFLACFSSY